MAFVGRGLAGIVSSVASAALIASVVDTPFASASANRLRKASFVTGDLYSVPALSGVMLLCCVPEITPSSITLDSGWFSRTASRNACLNARLASGVYFAGGRIPGGLRTVALIAIGAFLGLIGWVFGPVAERGVVGVPGAFGTGAGGGDDAGFVAVLGVFATATGVGDAGDVGIFAVPGRFTPPFSVGATPGFKPPVCGFAAVFAGGVGPVFVTDSGFAFDELTDCPCSDAIPARTPDSTVLIIARAPSVCAVSSIVLPRPAARARSHDNPLRKASRTAVRKLPLLLLVIDMV